MQVDTEKRDLEREREKEREGGRHGGGCHVGGIEHICFVHLSDLATVRHLRTFGICITHVIYTDTDRPCSLQPLDTYVK